MLLLTIAALGAPGESETCLLRDRCAAEVARAVSHWPAKRLHHLRLMANKTRWSTLLNSAIPVHTRQGCTHSALRHFPPVPVHSC